MSVRIQAFLHARHVVELACLPLLVATDSASLSFLLDVFPNVTNSPVSSAMTVPSCVHCQSSKVMVVKVVYECAYLRLLMSLVAVRETIVAHVEASGTAVVLRTLGSLTSSLRHGGRLLCFDSQGDRRCCFVFMKISSRVSRSTHGLTFLRDARGDWRIAKKRFSAMHGSKMYGNDALRKCERRDGI